MRLYVYTILSTVSLSMVFLLGYVCFLMFGGVMPSNSVHKRFSLVPYSDVIEHDVINMRLQPAENVQFTVHGSYFNGGVSVPYRVLQNSDISYLEVL